ncbi:hypothetical protein C8Q78DRAFT_757088 [Trametes maxima]|nr:hypothetical protein C8Q78DRAFT_757088 [Trametes maxima]
MAQNESSAADNAKMYHDPSIGDLCIRTSDGVEFHVEKRRIADASSVFSDMISFPQVPSEGPNSLADGKPVVSVSEASATWENLLAILLPPNDPDLTLEDIGDLLEAGKKYALHESFFVSMKYRLWNSRFLENNPLYVYALACGHGFRSVAQEAARYSLQIPVLVLAEPSKLPAFRLLSGVAIYHLLDFRKHCANAAVARVRVKHGARYPWIGRGHIIKGCSDPLCSPSVTIFV